VASGSPTLCIDFLSFLVDQVNGLAKFDGLARELRDVDDLGARGLVLDLGDAALVSDCISLAA